MTTTCAVVTRAAKLDDDPLSSLRAPVRGSSTTARSRDLASAGLRSGGTCS